MNDQSRVMRYEGLYPSQAEERFATDAAEAARNGWYPTEQAWIGNELVVTYVLQPVASASADAPSVTTGEPRPREVPVALLAVLAGGALLLIVAVLMWGGGNQAAPAATAVADPRVGPPGFRDAWCSSVHHGSVIADDVAAIGAAFQVPDLSLTSQAAKYARTEALEIKSLLEAAPRWTPTNSMVDAYYAWASTMALALQDISDGADAVDLALIRRGMVRMDAGGRSLDKAVQLYAAFGAMTGFGCDEPFTEPSALPAE